MFQRMNEALVIRSLLLVTMSALLFSFSRPLGMESFKVYLNDKLLFEQYMKSDRAVQSLSLDKASDQDILTVYYDHCGRIGNQRTLTLTDGSAVIKRWSFPDAQTIPTSGMNCPVKDIKALQKPGRTFNLVYASKDITEGVVLATVTPSGTDIKASRK